MSNPTNNITLIGRAGKDPESRTLDNGRMVTTFSLAVDRPTKDKETDWFTVKIWGKPAELAAEMVRKGAKLAVSGSINIETWDGREGQKQTSVVCQADNFQLLEPRAAGAPDSPPPPAPAAPPPPAPQFDPNEIPPF